MLGAETSCKISVGKGRRFFGNHVSNFYTDLVTEFEKLLEVLNSS